MTLSELCDRILALPIGDRWQLVQTILNSIQAETTGSHGETNGASVTAEGESSLQELRTSSEAAAVLAQALSDAKGEKNELSSDGFGFLPRRVDPLVFQKQLREEWDD
ncbi:hypothetical protein [Roseofilum sp. Guam]|uniref:hypothetical protein n=1 Tax=Roseofilum sp. Guam TaxID=2821502 RepID=UPI001B182410|nr:hypothetical protein [Roseofilum sp. Guam]MBP0030267.1 hypothetical protein [Roseofilum sp. Guam]